MRVREHTGRTHSLVSIANTACKLTRPKNVSLMLDQSADMRCLMMESSANAAIFSSTNIARGLSQYTKKMSVDQVRRELQTEDLKEEVMTLEDGVVLALLRSTGEKFRFMMDRTVGRGLRMDKYALLQKNHADLLTEQERETFFLIIQETWNLANLCSSIIAQPRLRRLPGLAPVLRKRHTLEEVHTRSTPREMLDRLQSVEHLTPSHSH